MTLSETIKAQDEEFEKRFPEKEFRQKFGDYADHAPASTHNPETGECMQCPVQGSHYDDIKDYLHLRDKAIAEAVREEEKERILKTVLEITDKGFDCICSGFIKDKFKI